LYVLRVRSLRKKRRIFKTPPPEPYGSFFAFRSGVMLAISKTGFMSAATFLEAGEYGVGESEGLYNW